MKIVFIIAIMFASFVVGYMYKQKIKNELDFLIYLKNFNDFLKSNINLFKNNLVHIIDEYKNLSNDKNAKFNEIFIKNGEIYEILIKNIEGFISNSQISFVIYNYLSMLGTNEYEFEENKIQSFSLYLDDKINEYTNLLKTKGELFFKVALSIGAIISILVW